MRSGLGITGYDKCYVTEWNEKDAVQIIEAPGNYEIKVDRWYYNKNCVYDWRVNNGGYVYRRDKDGKTIWMSRDVLEVEDRKLVVDHINGDTLDNREINLRVCTPAENSYNCRKVLDGVKSSSRFKGVLKVKKGWEGYINKNGVKISLGVCDNEAAMAKRYDAAAIYLFGEFARINFPWDRERLLEEYRRLVER